MVQRDDGGGEMARVLTCEEVFGSQVTGSGRALLLDRDGVVNVDAGYVCRAEDWVWVAGSRELVADARRAGWRVGVVTNQSGIGRGYYTEAEFLALTALMLAEMEAEVVVYCPHSPEALCAGRKPSPVMVEGALAFLGCGREGSFFIGDKGTDMEAARGAGVRGLRFEGGDLREFFLRESGLGRL